jgi:hypothetical protein
MKKFGRPAIPRLARRPWILVCLLGAALLFGGVLLLRKDISSLAGLFSQTGSGNPRMAERANQLPPVLMLTGIELLVLGYSGRRMRIRLRFGPAGERDIGHSKQNIMRGLLGVYALIAALTLNLTVVTVAGHLGSSLDDAEKIKKDFGEANGLVEAVRQQTPNDASILIQTQQPLKYLLNYELYPRHFYFHPNPSLNASEIPSHWMNDHHIGWILYIADDEPRHFALSKRKDTE